MANSHLGLAAFCLPTPKITSTRRPYPLHQSPSVGPTALRMTPDTKPLKIEPRLGLWLLPLLAHHPSAILKFVQFVLRCQILLSFLWALADYATIPRHLIPMPMFLTESSYDSFIAQCMSLPLESSLRSTQLHGLCSSRLFKELCFPITAPKPCRLSVFSFPWICVFIHIEGDYTRIIQGASSACISKPHSNFRTQWTHGTNDMLYLSWV